MTDIENRADIDLLMKQFYEKALADEKIGYLFTEVAKLDLKHHLPIIGDFWESLLFGARNYQLHGRNPLQVHGELHKKSPLKPEHFERWLELFNGCVDRSFQGEHAEFAKQRAGMIANRMLSFVGSYSSSAG